MRHNWRTDDRTVFKRSSTVTSVFLQRTENLYTANGQSQGHEVNVHIIYLRHLAFCVSISAPHTRTLDFLGLPER